MTYDPRLILFFSIASSILGCQTGASDPPKSPERAPVQDHSAVRLATPDVDALVAKMTLDEKVGQMTQADMSAMRTGREVRELFLGSVLSGGNSLPRPNEPQSWADMYDGYQQFALGTRFGIPILYGVDAVHGHGSVRGAVVFPHHIGLGATRDAALVERIGRVTAEEVAATGLDWAFSPCIAVPRDERWGRTYEGFGETPELAETLGAAEIKGLEQEHILACAKHFLGDGGTFEGHDQGDTRESEEEIRRIHLPGYRAAIAAGVGSVMVSYSSINGAPMHGNKYWITDVLKGELGFQGFVVSDWAGVDKLPGDDGEKVRTAINAGIDMVMEPYRYSEFTETLMNQVNARLIPMSRIDDAVRRILRQKVRFGLWDHPFTDRSLAASIGSAAHRALARTAVAESVVLLKNQSGVLPLHKDSRVLLLGPKADDIGAQCGGWTVGWHGGHGPRTPGTSLREAFEHAAAGQVTYAAAPTDALAASANAVVAVIGEEPYAEGRGDRRDLALAPEDRALVAAAKRTGKPLVVVLLSGRPLILDEVLSSADALLAAWLPGTEGDGVADVLYGAVEPRGKLPHSWPRSMAQIPINFGDERYDPLFAFGFGLSYGKEPSASASPDAASSTAAAPTSR